MKECRRNTVRLKDMKLEDLELLSYTDITYYLLKEDPTSLNTANLFRKVCDLLGYTEEEFMSKIGDYYTSLAIDKRFVLLENNEWSLREKHAVALDMDEEELEDESVDEEMEEETDTIEESEFDDVESLVDDEDIEEDMDEVAIMAEDELEEDN